ncbi:MAG TPA: hypothetical protein VNV66_18905, partial [Pilimelia sp.]|nr:hypothetical protein [Pilimelia sp.]
MRRRVTAPPRRSRGATGARVALAVLLLTAWPASTSARAAPADVASAGTAPADVASGTAPGAPAAPAARGGPEPVPADARPAPAVGVAGVPVQALRSAAADARR